MLILHDSVSIEDREKEEIKSYLRIIRDVNWKSVRIIIGFDECF